MRKLASVRKIADINSIPDADNIVVARVDGWSCVVRKDQFNVGDKVVYLEIDSVVPVDLLKRANLWDEKTSKGKLRGPGGDRVKTITIRNQISQGLVFPLQGFVDVSTAEGADVTEQLGITKYEPELKFINADILGEFPHFIRKTDQERIQNMFSHLQSLPHDLKFEVSEKLDGTSATFFHHEGRFGACSRNFEKKLGKESAWDCVAEELELNHRLKDTSVALQGELIGPGIQSNSYKLKKPTLKIFDVFDIRNQRYLSSKERMDFLGLIGLDARLHHVPTFSNVSLEDFESLDILINWADGRSELADVPREGLVFKSFGDVRNYTSFKVISNEWLRGNKNS
jgi:RNA ligase (TIGR02306 family)